MNEALESCRSEGLLLSCYLSDLSISVATSFCCAQVPTADIVFNLSRTCPFLYQRLPSVPQPCQDVDISSILAQIALAPSQLAVPSAAPAPNSGTAPLPTPSQSPRIGKLYFSPQVCSKFSEIQNDLWLHSIYKSLSQHLSPFFRKEFQTFTALYT